VSKFDRFWMEYGGIILAMGVGIAIVYALIGLWLG